MAKLKLLVVLSVFSLLFSFGICPGWAAIYGVVTEPAYTNPNGPVEIPLKFNITKGLQNFDLKAIFDPAKLDFDPNQNQYNAGDLYQMEVYQQPDDPNEIRISGMVNNVQTLPLAVTQGLYQMKFLTLKFQAKSATAEGDPTIVGITGITDPGNPLSGMPSTQSKVAILEQSYEVDVHVDWGGNDPNSYEVKLWGASSTTGQAIDQRKSVSAGVADTAFYVPAGTYYVMAQSKGYKVDQVARVNTADLKPVNFTFTQLKRRVAIVSRVITNNEMELNFSYLENDGAEMDWDSNVPLTLEFYESGDISDPNGPAIDFDPNSRQTTGNISGVNSAALIEDPNGFDKDYICLNIDPNVYCKSEDSTSYSLAFRVRTTNTTIDGFDPFDVTFQVDKLLGTTKKTEKSMGQVTSVFKAGEIASVGSVPVKVDFYLTDDPTDLGKKMESTFTVNNIDANYFKMPDPNTIDQYIYVNPNTLADLSINMIVEFKPKADDPDSTVAHIRFTDAYGRPLEYDPPADLRDMAGAIEFDIPLHKDLQTEFAGEDYSDPNVLDEVLGRLVTEQSQENTPRMYKIYYQGVNDSVPVPFFPEVQNGESISVWADPVEGLLYAHVVTKHASDWFIQEVTAEITPTSGGSDDDEWYECFIQVISPHVLGK